MPHGRQNNLHVPEVPHNATMDSHKTHRDRAMPPVVWLFGAVSLCNDVASEMILPLLPAFLTLILGAGPAALGLIEGLAEAVASLSKLASGFLADRMQAHKAFALGGYTVSNLLRPLIGLSQAWPAVLMLRFGDRLGKGLRTAPRDALLAESVDATRRGRAFGIHRTMDHAGAMIGPLIAAGLLAAGTHLRDIFLYSLIPGLIAVGLLAISLPRIRTTIRATTTRLAWHQLSPASRRLIPAVAAITLVAMPDTLMLLWIQQTGMHMAALPLLWSAAHLLRSMTAGPFGALSDRLGRIPILTRGLTVRALIVATIPWLHSHLIVIAGFLLYSTSTAITEAAERAVVGDEAGHGKGTAFGWYHMLAGILALPGGIILGELWQQLGIMVAFSFSAACLLLLALLLRWLPTSSPAE